MLKILLPSLAKRGMSWNGEINPFSFSEEEKRRVEIGG